MKSHIVPFFAALLFFSVGCRTQRLMYGNYQSFHRDDVVLDYQSSPKVSWSDKTPEEDYADAMSHNFAPIGESVFPSHRRVGSGIVSNLARSQGASIACVYSSYAGHETVYAPLALPTSSTTTTSFSGYGNGSMYGNSFGSGGFSSYNGWGSSSFSGTATSTTYGTQITPIPIVRHWRNYRVVLYAPLREKQKIGLIVANLDEKTATQIGTRQGVVVQSAPKGFACYDADILNGDIVTHIDGQKIKDSDNFKEVLAALPEHGEITLKIFRRNVEIEKTISY